MTVMHSPRRDERADAVDADRDRLSSLPQQLVHFMEFDRLEENKMLTKSKSINFQ